MQKANVGKSLIIEAHGERYERIPVRTHVITSKDKLEKILEKYVKPVLREGDVVFMSEKAVACTQRRAIRMDDIHPRPLAKLLSRFVYKTPYGIGLGIPETMEMALRECGTLRILFAALVSAIGKLFGKRGWFYIIAGEKARAIDGPCDYAIPPYNEYVVLGPKDPEKTARNAAKEAGIPLFCIVDLNDLGGNILGVSSDELKSEWLLPILRDNPLGQSDEQTPIGIIRPAGASSGQWFYKERENILADLRRLVRINSVAEPESDIKPFGQGCREVLDEMLKICVEHGVDCANHEYYCGSAFLPGETEKETGIFSHLDIVPVSGEWIYPVLEGAVDKGFMFGRGVVDNKSAAIMGLYLQLYFRENNIQLKNGLRVFFGCCEENGMGDLSYYRERYKVPGQSLVPDSVFPVCYGEKGIFNINIVSPPLSGNILCFEGGLVTNMVADSATLKLKPTPQPLEMLDGLRSFDNINVEKSAEAVTITALGKPAHAAYPEGSVNAIGLLASFAVTNNLVTGEDKHSLAFIASICGENRGESLGVAAAHEEFGKLTCVAGKVRMEDGKLVLSINIRYPYSEKADVIGMVIKARCVENGFTTRDMTDSPPSYVARESAFVTALAEAYREVTGDSPPDYIMGGGTYARMLPNAVAFGTEFPGENQRPGFLPEGHGGPHQPDEALHIDGFLEALEIYAHAILKIDGI